MFVNGCCLFVSCCFLLLLLLLLLWLVCWWVLIAVPSNQLPNNNTNKNGWVVDGLFVWLIGRLLGCCLLLVVRLFVFIDIRLFVFVCGSFVCVRLWFNDINNKNMNNTHNDNNNKCCLLDFC